MIIGIGTDIVSVERLAKLYRRYGQKFAEKLLSLDEQEDFAKANNKGAFLAKRFAAKEAFGKALGIGVAAPATLPNITVTHDKLGKPSFAYAPPLSALMAERGLHAQLSISDEQKSALAFVILEEIKHT